jgi:lipopolysaccharide biosynthesis glycosyltransferase
MKYIDIAFGLNRAIYLSLLTTINSIIKNTKYPENIRFNIVVPDDEISFFENILEETFPNHIFTLRLKTFNPSEMIKDYLLAKYPENSADRRKSRIMQFSRFFLRDIFPDISRIIYLDTDLIFLKDVANLFNAVESFSQERYFAAAPQYLPPLGHFNNLGVALNEIKDMHYSFNSGVFLTDFSYWNEETYARLKYYLELDSQHGYKLYRVGDESILNLMFKNFIELDRNWNRCGYGNSRLVAYLLRCDLEQANVIHWSGGYHKPWKTDKIIYGDLWRYYKPISLVS